jgi:hypothetical protein
VATCSCCGQPRDPATLVALQCHADIAICPGCIDWLRRGTGALDVTPTLPVVHMNEAVEFYEMAGFDVRRYDDGFAFVSYADGSVFDLGLEPKIDPTRNGAGCYIVTPDAEEWHARLASLHLRVDSIADTPWGMREFTLTDPSGNRIRFGRSI